MDKLSAKAQAWVELQKQSGDEAQNLAHQMHQIRTSPDAVTEANTRNANLAGRRTRAALMGRQLERVVAELRDSFQARITSAAVAEAARARRSRIRTLRQREVDREFLRGLKKEGQSGAMFDGGERQPEHFDTPYERAKAWLRDLELDVADEIRKCKHESVPEEHAPSPDAYCTFYAVTK